MLLGAIILWILSAGSLDARTVKISGFILDGAASSSALMRSKLAAGDKSWQTPLAGQEVQVRALGDLDKSWTTKTGEDGAFEIDTGLAAIPENTPFVIVADSGGPKMFSRSFDPHEKGARLFVAPAGAATSKMNTETIVIHDMKVVRDDEGDETQRFLRVQIRVVFYNFDSTIYIGEEKGGVREVCRIPLPPGATIVRNEGFAPGAGARLSGSGKFLIFDDPVPGLSDFAMLRQSGKPGPTWTVEYLVPPTKFFSLEYPVSISPAELRFDEFNRPASEPGFRVYVLKDGIEKQEDEDEGEEDKKGKKGMQVHSTDLKRFDPVSKNPIDGRKVQYNTYVPAKIAAKNAYNSGDKFLVPLELSDVARGVISRKALFWHGGTMIVCLFGIVLGLTLGRKGPPPETILEEGLSSEQIIEKIAELDRRYEGGEIRKEEYERFRESLVAVAADEVGGAAGNVASEAGAPPPLASEDVIPSVLVSDRAKDLLTKIEDLDAREDLSAEEIQQRAHLLEALFKTVRKDAEGKSLGVV